MSFLKPLFTDEHGKQLSESQQKKLIQDEAYLIADKLNHGNWETFDNFSWREQSYDDMVNIVMTFTKSVNSLQGITVTPEQFQDIFLDELEKDLDLAEPYSVKLNRDSCGITDPCESSDHVLQAQLAFQWVNDNDDTED